MKRVLLVDDHNLFRESLALGLKTNTDLQECIQAKSLAEARRVLDNSDRKLDLAIVDLDLASAGGFELIKELRVSHPDVPVLALTFEPDANSRDRALRAGAAEVLNIAASQRDIVEVARGLASE
ncbi:MAG TPA: response regulator [Rubrobacteraceae bacterium]|jgi:DNA-binding NarL/FixJ family response regulator|nr:response regulator [Rubrobacteraceae bacterium]